MEKIGKKSIEVDDFIENKNFKENSNFFLFIDI